MTKLWFHRYLDYEDGKIANLETAGDECCKIPLNIFIDNYEKYPNMNEEICSMNICGVGSDIKVFPSEDAFKRSGSVMAPVSLIPAGTFPDISEDNQSGQSPIVYFTGIVQNIDFDIDAEEDKPNYCLKIKTLEIEIELYCRYDCRIEAGNIVQGEAWLYGCIFPGGYDYDLAHDYSCNHKPELERDSVCGCFYCLKIFRPTEIKEWLIYDNDADKRGTALCPYCDIDSVIGESSGFPITKEFLAVMKDYWF